MDSKKQKLLLEYLISSTDTFAICQAIIQPNYFDPEFRNTVKWIKKYYEEYHTTPSGEQISAETGINLDEREIQKDQIAYCTTEIERFCKRRAFENAILASPKSINEENYGAVMNSIKDALLVSLHKDLGLHYFEDPQTRLEQMLKGNVCIPTLWTEVDELLYGGPSRGELLLFSALPGRGKSISLANLGFNYIEQGLNVCYISFELSEQVIAQRFDTMFTGISRRDWQQHISEISVRVQSSGKGKGTLDIKQLPTGTTAADIKAYLKEYYLHFNYMPDLLIIDYVDLMHPNEKIDLGDVFTKDKLCSEQIRDIGVEFNLLVASASQLNRSAVNAKQHDYGQIAGGISKINTADIYISINFTDQMQASGEIAYVFQKTRNSDGAGKVVYLRWDSKHLRIINRPTTKPESNFARKSKLTQIKEEILSDEPTGDSLINLMPS